MSKPVSALGALVGLLVMLPVSMAGMVVGYVWESACVGFFFGKACVTNIGEAVAERNAREKKSRD